MCYKLGMRLTDEQLADLDLWTPADLNDRTGDHIQALVDEVRERRAAAGIHTWETVYDDDATKVMRFRVPGGWLYQIAERTDEMLWHPPVFVPERVEFHHLDGAVTP